MAGESPAMEYAVKTGNGKIVTEWDEDYLKQLKACNSLIDEAEAYVIQRIVARSEPFRAVMRVDVNPIEATLFAQLSANKDLANLSEIQKRNLAQDLSINALPVFTEGLAQAIFKEAKSLYDAGTEVSEDKLDKVYNFLSWLRSVGGVGSWSRTAGAKNISVSWKTNNEDEDNEDEEE